MNSWRIGCNPLCFFGCPVRGTASKAREIPRADVPFAPLPLRSCDFPHGLPSFSGIELKRVELANELFRYTCRLFSLCVQRGKLLATMENPRGVVGYNGKPKRFLVLADRLCFGADAESPAVLHRFSGLHVWLDEGQVDADCCIIQGDCTNGCCL